MTSPPNAPDPATPGPASPDPASPDPASPDPATPGSASPDPKSSSAPGSPWILLDRTTAEQAAAVLDRLEEWLAGADPAATEACAHACSHGQADAFEVAAWVGTLAAHLRDRIEEVDSWS